VNVAFSFGLDLDLNIPSEHLRQSHSNDWFKKGGLEWATEIISLLGVWVLHQKHKRVDLLFVFISEDFKSNPFHDDYCHGIA
jgi:hypothetical protein